jgi:predicted transcriptional regulator
MDTSNGRSGRANTVGIDAGIGPLEAQVLRCISELPSPVTVRQVCDALERSGYFAYQGVLNCMNRLVKKDILEREKQGTAYVYRPLVDIEQLAAQVVTNVIDHMGGRVERVVCWVLKIDPDTGADRIADLRREVRRAARKTKR